MSSNVLGQSYNLIWFSIAMMGRTIITSMLHLPEIKSDLPVKMITEKLKKDPSTIRVNQKAMNMF